jgi:hypothetical protein
LKAKAGIGGDDHYVRVKYNENTLQLEACAEKGDHYKDDPSLCTYNAFMGHMKRCASTRIDHKNICQPLLKPTLQN